MAVLYTSGSFPMQLRPHVTVLVDVHACLGTPAADAGCCWNSSVLSAVW